VAGHGNSYPATTRPTFFYTRSGKLGYQLRFGFFEIDKNDAELIAEAMLSTPEQFELPDRLRSSRKIARAPASASLTRPSSRGSARAIEPNFG
jgi:hypothetical protein